MDTQKDGTDETDRRAGRTVVGARLSTGAVLSVSLPSTVVHNIHPSSDYGSVSASWLSPNGRSSRSQYFGARGDSSIFRETLTFDCVIT